MIEALLLMLGLHIFGYGFYAPNQTDKLLWIIMAMCIAVGYVVTAEIARTDLRENFAGAELDGLRDGPIAGSLRRVGG